MKTPPLTTSAALAASLIALSLLLAACGDKSATKDVHGASTPATAAAQPHVDPEKLTHFTDRSELFLEFPTRIVGRPAAFAAHLTRLADF